MKRRKVKTPDHIFPDTEAGAMEALRDMSILTPIAAAMDPHVEGVWLVHTKEGKDNVVWLAGYKEPLGAIRKFNDFETED